MEAKSVLTSYSGSHLYMLLQVKFRKMQYKYVGTFIWYKLGHININE